MEISKVLFLLYTKLPPWSFNFEAGDFLDWNIIILGTVTFFLDFLVLIDAVCFSLFKKRKSLQAIVAFLCPRKQKTSSLW